MYVDGAAKMDSGVFQRFDDADVAVSEMGVFACESDMDRPLRMHDFIDQSFPIGDIRFS